MPKFPLIFSLLAALTVACSLPTAKEAGIRHATTPAFPIPTDIEWREVGLAKEIIHTQKKSVFLSGGPNPVPLDTWDDFKVGFPWQKNIDRHILIDKTALIRSPGAKSGCQKPDCLRFETYKGYTWVELAQPLAIDFVPAKTDILKPAKGHLVIKTIKKCQVVRFEREIYRLSDQKGNLYAMHATETGTPDLGVVLPEGWKLEKVALDQPLEIAPFGQGEECYFNIVGDHLGQGYHQYQYAGAFYPAD